FARARDGVASHRREARGGGGPPVRHTTWALLASTAVPFFSPVVRADDPAKPLVGLTFDHYSDNAAIAKARESIHAAYPQWTQVEEMGKSREGRPLWMISVFDPNGERPRDERPAMYIDANTHGNEVQGGEVALFTVKYLLERKDGDPWVAALL